MVRIKPPPQAASPSLDGVIISFASYSLSAHPELSHKTVAQLKTDIANCGGSYTTKPDQCTHLITTHAQFEKKLNRITQAQKNVDTQVVSYEWLAASLASSAPVDIDQYLLESSPTNDDGIANGNGLSPSQKAATRSSKRSRKDDDDEDNPIPTKKSRPSKAAGEPTPATTTTPIKVPVDHFVPSAPSFTVHVDDSGVIYDATLNKSDAKVNNNKFYRLQLLRSTSGFYTWTRWGRVGERGQNKMLGDGSLDDALSYFGVKFKEKAGLTWENRDAPSRKGKYAYLEINYADSEDEGEKGAAQVTRKGDGPVKEKVFAESKLMPPVQRLMELIFNLQFFNNTMADFDYDASKMPLGKLSKKTLLKGYEVLKDLALLIADPSVATGLGEQPGQAVMDRSNQYFSLVPHVVGRRSLPVLRDMNSIKREIQLLETLTDMQLANEIMKSAAVEEHKSLHMLDRQYQGLGMKEMIPLDQDSQEFSEIFCYLNKSTGSTHGVTYAVQDIFRIERSGESDRLEESPYANLGSKSDRRLLWHGSRVSNFGGILSQGLRIAPPEAPVSGYMFGKGVYLADMSSKSANYCATYNSAGTGLLLLCEAELGKPSLKLTDADSNAGDRVQKRGCISTWGVGQTGPSVWKDASCVHPSLKGVKMPDVVNHPPGPTNESNAYLLYNEYIVYDVAQIRLRYLVRVNIN
ncbi:uncharacterized protein PV07_07170 [Cladophialophora immunda]|uniref:Poly [ADP-ribose] polymerase n=1 Tax=Cladophialophora immunda TaxID=569365 RepID=A0A0D2C8M2_9EURO|nr:uncharacterized protein PV07_07170 [Cladophialophora immunda]KIW27433.1 hypothetical protein PV07_07170 [Cladophialophora immunda]OQV05132.1 WGR domain-containing protein [Cladophialophora immunda]